MTIRTKKIYFFLVVLVIAILSAAAYIQFSSKQKSIEKYLSVDLKSAQDEVIYRLGHPTFVWKKSKENDDFNNVFIKYISPYKSHTNLIMTSKLEKGDDIKNYDYWSYQDENTSTHIKFGDDKKVKSIACFTSKRAISPEEWLASTEYCKLNGITLYVDEDKVKSLLGQPSESSLVDGVKTLKYNHLNISIQFERMKAISIIVGE